MVEVVGDKLVMRALQPKIVDNDPRVAEEILHEEYELEKNRYVRMIRGNETSLDTSVIVEYIVSRSPYRPKIAEIFSRALAHELELFVSVVTLSEVLYIASRIYQVAGIDDPNKESMILVEWIKSRARIIRVSEDIAIRARELKNRLRIALPGCYVIASAEIMGATSLFRSLEEEMRPVINDLRKLGVRFLDKIEL